MILTYLIGYKVKITSIVKTHTHKPVDRNRNKKDAGISKDYAMCLKYYKTFKYKIEETNIKKWMIKNS